ncbi:oxidoreductase [Anaerococcus porci]|uniref:oxidoreductase n=1 Tax=Anaerococcus porci TaxID=2652269 RepID=UPI002A7508C6|nr:oxidoreductase [Anaerococcus porci]MDY3005486.1 oxidoreductase [Anaerococcus porci]
MRKKKNSIKKNFNKNKYNIILIIIAIIFAVFLLAKIIDNISNKNLSKYDNEMIVIKNKDNEITSLSLRDIRKMGGQNSKINQHSDVVIDIEGLSLDRLINKVDIDPNLNNIIEFIDGKGNKTSIALESALEVDRVYLVYKTINKANIDFDKKLGVFYVVDKQQKDANKWIKNVKIINIK